ncbi:hypothetical protein PHYBLDRAFT_142912 [Phycomyces blakesleeanus NRRL 1555(-)]|uniref:Uncharacterized protein n=1 Tax=Phycomyces blakesleeanus (strain ATCC 8743b / DSM 1359 / FGSC 10004 / NBRC 33097 / NRRL 1555) TaxID=763407 RepID=A0A167NHR5_PHYB8|nr:hypothetical protein PHYBLDRAFT_142911 [Phycomyces blakesleeanus NRRL 1555(-)]XP_018293969.1 hypothetical protein PHYBLDRAFT_142912 [Phycomyces blakesleeanus NRRL 1555(-)]OAD75928.1 hypothetical protein PHYBLDRAFT_142911 [Phycomyces blakesleeanus NRRL 1555(-)]OAD75929.1 hypothetical protein PHYBLDRAFT_142912 [Phycomyces blakesleeanus NRRL 1555(-)]|eukprot:XP_018293968.1 hypothetical protein PHYBLDRAFT_142911 [Phycomyces blakesleeanus NRRL 1555(-)]
MHPSIHPPPPISPKLLIDKNFRVLWFSFFFSFFFVLTVSTGGDDGELLGPDGVEPRVKHGISSKSTSARVACEPAVRIPVYYWLLSVVSSGGRGCLLLPPVGHFCQWPPVAGCQFPAARFTSTGGSIYLTGRRHLSHWSDICFLLLPVASAGEPDGSISAAKWSDMSCPQDTLSKADKAHQKPNMGASKKATPGHKKGQSMRQSKDQSGPQDRPMLQVRTRERASRPTRKAKVYA